MKYTDLGATGIKVSCIGLGTVKFGRNQGVRYPKAFELPSDHEIIELLHSAEELGINLLDTAPAYGNSEERLGRILKNKWRNWIVCTKVGEEFINSANGGVSHFDFSKNAIQKSIERSLKRLNTDVLDIVLVHSNGEDKKIIEEHQVFENLAELKKQGKLRAFGMSTKTIEGGMLTVDYSDVVMVTYNLLQTDEKPVITYAQQKHKGVLIKKAFASGHLHNIPGEDPVKESLQFILKEPGVSSIILGTLNKEHLHENVKKV